MTVSPRIEYKNAEPTSGTGVVLGDDWHGDDTDEARELNKRRARRSYISLKRSPLARKIITFNLLALIVLVAGVLYLNPFRTGVVIQRERALVSQAQLISNVFEAQLPQDAPVSLSSGDGIAVKETLSVLSLSDDARVLVFDPSGQLVGEVDAATGGEVPPVEGLTEGAGGTYMTDFLNSVWDWTSKNIGLAGRSAETAPIEEQALELIEPALAGTTTVRIFNALNSNEELAVATPIRHGNEMVGVVVLTSATTAVEQLVRSEREKVLQMFVVAIIVSVGLSLVLASTMANPLSDLAAAAELGRDKDARKMNPGRVRIPDLTARPDEIGRLSGALRGMVSALYDRIDANEQFAADVAHEIKNPLASLRSAVGTLRVAKRDDQRTKLLDVIDHDVRRLDRLVSDISNASRLDSELVKEEEEEFDMLSTVGNLATYMQEQASEKGVEFIIDLPRTSINIMGLEARLAQVFVNLISNAISFCEDGDAIRIWARKRENRVLIVVEDTGPGIPDQALANIFKRFYSERPEGQFGNNSGLGLAISKQIVEAHGGVIWAENIRPTDADVTSEPLGARFVVGLPV